MRLPGGHGTVEVSRPLIQEASCWAISRRNTYGINTWLQWLLGLSLSIFTSLTVNFDCCTFLYLCMLPLRNLFICSLHLRPIPYPLQLSLHQGVLSDIQPGILMLKQPRVEMHIHSAIACLEHTLATTLLQLPLQHIIRPICLRHVSLQRVLVLHLVVMSVPVRLPRWVRGSRQGRRSICRSRLSLARWNWG